MRSSGRPWITAAVLVAAALLPALMPSLGRFQILRPGAFARTFVDPFRGRPKVPLWSREAVIGAHESPAPAGDSPAPSRQEPLESSLAPRLRAVPAHDGTSAQDGFLVDPGDALKGFYSALRWAELGVGVVRVLHLGDSVVTGDLITAEAGARLRKAYGDGGPGWMYLARPWEWYMRLGVTLEGGQWQIFSPLLTARKDRRYGLAGLAFSGTPEAETVLRTAKHHPFSRITLHYFAMPKGGSVILQVDRQPPVVLSTAGEPGPAASAFANLEDTPHTLTLKPKGDGDILLYGLVLERDGAGVVYDAIGSNGGAIHHLAHLDAHNWIAALGLRHPDLVILGFGTNESGYYNIPGPAYATDYREVVRRIREALPEAGILLMGPLDRGERGESGEIVTMPRIIKITEAQRKIAEDLGCAFFDTFQAMGGEGAAGRWYFNSPRLMTADFTHPTRAGADRVASLLVESLQARYRAFRQARTLEESSAASRRE